MKSTRTRFTLTYKASSSMGNVDIYVDGVSPAIHIAGTLAPPEKCIRDDVLQVQVSAGERRSSSSAGPESGRARKF